jgi:two-component system sensor histidine kinase/response regulator
MRASTIQDSLFTPESVSYARRLLGWRSIMAICVLLLYTSWGVYVVSAAKTVQGASDQRYAWLHQLEWARHDLLTHNPEAPSIREAFGRLTRVRGEIEAVQGTSGSTAKLGQAVRGLRDLIDVPGERDRARTELVEAIHIQVRALHAELGGLAQQEAFRWRQMQYLTLSAVAMATLALFAMLLARHRRLLSEQLGMRLEAAIREAETARQDAQRANQAKSRFLATVSHELRTPMTAILGTVDLLSMTVLSSRQADYLTAVRSSGQTLQRLIDDVLDLSRIEAGRLELNKESFQLDAMLDDLALMFGERAERAGLSLTFLTEGLLPSELYGDSLRLRQVLVNLIGNALKFTTEGSIELMVRRDPDSPELLRFEVQDTGPGLRPDQIARVFEPFTQADSSLTRTHGGAGLGLAICQRLVGAMGGALGVTSEPGRGCTFRFTAALPEVSPARDRRASGPMLLLGRGEALEAASRQLTLWGMEHLRARDAASAEEVLHDQDATVPGTVLLDDAMPAPRHPVMLTWRAVRLLPFSASGGPTDPGVARNLVAPIRPSLLGAVLDATDDGAPLPTWEPTPLAGGHRVMVVDDNEMNRLVLAEMLVTIGCRVTLAEGGERALERVAEDRFDLIFMDSEMPVMDGFETTRRLRAAGVTSERTPILGLSGHVTPEHRKQGMAAGMDDYLAKPIQLGTLQRAVRQWCQER